jgi:hypothetical protein
MLNLIDVQYIIGQYSRTISKLSVLISPVLKWVKTRTIHVEVVHIYPYAGLENRESNDI